jgi:hypothetical protein
MLPILCRAAGCRGEEGVCLFQAGVRHHMFESCWGAPGKMEATFGGGAVAATWIATGICRMPYTAACYDSGSTTIAVCAVWVEPAPSIWDVCSR